MVRSKYDFVVVGSGPAGQKAAIQAAKLGHRVALVERKMSLGGVSTHTGTIPSKTLREAVLYLSGFKQRTFYGRGHRLKQDIEAKDLTERLAITVEHEVEIVRDQLARNGVEVLGGLARFVGPHRMVIEDETGSSTVEGDKILVATGTRPRHPDCFQFDGRVVMDSDDVLRLEELPRSMVIVGAGVIGVEYASIFAALDVRVTLVDSRASMLDFVDQEIVDTFIALFRDRGVTLRLGEEVATLEKSGGRVITRLASGREVHTDVALVTAGRVGNTGGLDLHAAGLNADDRGRLAVDGAFRTEVPHIYAAGDVIGFPSLASTSMEQGRLAACHAFGADSCSTSSQFPFGIYAVPEISMVGKTEQQLREEGVGYEVGVARLREIARGQILGLDSGLLKLIVALEDRRVLGVHILGEGATELIHIGQAVLNLDGTLDYFLENVFNYPTLAEAYKVAALDAHNRMPRSAKRSLRLAG
ncbi:MAG: Si-specific NAD(P)(+) transhydrogenase [Deltaproteobacteria bacterium]|jgi:NAD(P) transhydrogenase